MPARGLRFAFVACTRNRHLYRGDPSYIYRCESLGEALKAAGHHVVFVHLTQVVSSERVDVAVFHRPSMSPAFWLATRWLRLRGTQLIADVDDLVFMPELAAFSPAVLNGQLPIDKVEKSFASNRNALKTFAYLTTSTEPLAEHLGTQFKQARIYVFPNSIHHRWLSEFSPNAQGSPGAKGPGGIISYNPGTRSHDRDFEVYAYAASRYLLQYPDARLVVTGPLRLDVSGRPGQIVHHEKVPFSEYHKSLCGAWINLAPLEPTPFTRCKSAVKIFEAGFWGTPTICSSTSDAQRFANAGALFAEDAGACFALLDGLRDPAQYLTVAAGLHGRVKAIADIRAEAKQFVSLVEEQVL